MAFGGETAESYYDEGLTASMKGDLRAAITHFEKAIQLDNSMATAYHQLGKCYHRMGKVKKAVAFLQQVTTKKPDQLPPRIDLGYAQLSLGRTGDARASFEEVIARKVDNTRALLGLGLCSFHEGQWEAAMTVAQQVVAQTGANFAAYFLLCRAARLAGIMEVAIEAHRTADTLIEKTIETTPDSPEGYYLRGELHFAQEDLARALDAYRAAEDRVHPDKSYLAYGEHFSRLDIIAKRGLCLQRLGREDAAREAGELILKADPEHRIGQLLYYGPGGGQTQILTR